MHMRCMVIWVLALLYRDACRSESGLCGVQGLRAALNAALFRTGDQSRDFAVVLATNRPADLDPAVLDRMDEALEFPLPGPAERAAILQLYVDSYIAKAGTAEGRDYFVRSAETMSHELGWKQVKTIAAVSRSTITLCACACMGPLCS